MVKKFIFTSLALSALGLLASMAATILLCVSGLILYAFKFSIAAETLMSYTMEDPRFWVIPGLSALGLIISSTCTAAYDDSY